MSRKLLWVILVHCVSPTLGLLCYNCSETHESWSQCAGEFAPPYVPFNNSRVLLLNCTGESAMCFVRSWRARAKPAWIVQRGCYQSHKDDPIPQTMSSPTRAMSCNLRRLPEAEYKVCLCTANWCNSASVNIISFIESPMNCVVAVLVLYNVYSRIL